MVQYVESGQSSLGTVNISSYLAYNGIYTLIPSQMKLDSAWIYQNISRQGGPSYHL